jgi:hypothetical protein
MPRKEKADYINCSGQFEVPVNETVAETWKRLAAQQAKHWPGSVSIKGHMHTKPRDVRS